MTDTGEPPLPFRRGGTMRGLRGSEHERSTPDASWTSVPPMQVGAHLPLMDFGGNHFDLDGLTMLA
jgi:hypothetical protein